MEKPDLTWHDQLVSLQQRQQLMGQRGCVAWFTGLSGSGKSTVANLVDLQLHQQGIHSFLLDGDNIRQGLNAAAPQLLDRGEDFANRFGLGFSPQDREENIRRVGAVAELFAATGVVTLVACVSPYRRDRDAVRQVITARLGASAFHEVFVDTPLDICESRDPKGLYKKARAGQLSGMTGIDAPYEPPEQAELVLDGGGQDPAALADQLVQALLPIIRLPDSSDQAC